MRALFLVSLLSIAGCGTAEKVPEGIMELRSGGLRAVIADNEAHGAVHRAGYSGVAELEPAGLGRNVFVPAVAGLNFEHILSGDGASYGRDIFEPRRAPMTLWRLSGSSVELRQERTESWPLRTRLTYALAGEDAIDLTVTATPLASEDWKKHGWLGLFLASYIDAPEDRAIHFIGRSRPGKGDATPRWIRHLSPRHGEAACHRPAGSEWDPPMDPGLPIPLAAGHSDLEYIYPFYYGVTRGKALIYLFEKPAEKTEARLAQSPTGGGEKNPAWDFIFITRGVEPGKEIEFRMRLVCREFRGREDVIRAYEAWSGERVERPREEDPVARLLEHVHTDMLYEPAVVQDEENAYLVWQRLPEDADLEDETAESEEEEDAVLAAEGEGPFPTGPLGERLAKAIEAWEAIFRTWDEGIARGRFQWPRGRTGLDPEEKDRAFSLIMRLARAHRCRVLRAKLAAARGQFHLAEKDIVAFLRTAAILASAEENLMVHLMAAGQAYGGYRLMRWLAHDEDTPLDLLERLMPHLAGPPDRTSGARALRGEFRTFFLPPLARIPDGADPSRLAEAHAEDIEAGPYRESVVRYTAAILEGHPKPFDKEATVRLASEIMARLVRSLGAPWRDRPRNVAAGVVREMEGWPEELVKPETPFPQSKDPVALSDDMVRKAHAALRPVDNPFGKVQIRGVYDGGFFRAFEDLCVEGPRTIETDREATRAVLALRIHARRNGGVLPAGLEDLVAAKILPSVPRDPFTDEPFRYSRERAIVWSAGPDGKDDGGREEEPEDSEAPSDLVWKLAPIPRGR
jgi:hypothetical protein